MVASSIIIPNESCVLNFEVSGEFDIGICEERKCREYTEDNLIGMSVPSFQPLNSNAKKTKKRRFFDPKDKRLTKGWKKLQILIDREEGSMSFTVGGIKSKKKLYSPQLKRDDPW